MSLKMTSAEIEKIDADHITPLASWATSRTYEAEQLAFDATRLLSCTGERMDKLAKQGFAKRIWSRVTGEASAIERANTNDLIHMQKISLRYIKMLEEQELLLAHSMLSLKNNLYSLAIKEEETRNIVALLAEGTLKRFEQLENRLDRLETSTNLHGWLLGLEEREYEAKYPTEHIRLFRVINDFYGIKSDEWNYNDLMFMRKAIRTVGLNPNKKISLNTFINTLTDEINQDSVGFTTYQGTITKFKPEGVDNYSNFVIEQISSPVFISIHGLNVQYMDRLDVVETLIDQMSISKAEALKILLRKSIENLNVNLDYEFTLAETAIEILGCMRLAKFLSGDDVNSNELEDLCDIVESSSYSIDKFYVIDRAKFYHYNNISNELEKFPIKIPIVECQFCVCDNKIVLLDYKRDRDYNGKYEQNILAKFIGELTFEELIEEFEN